MAAFEIAFGPSNHRCEEQIELGTVNTDSVQIIVGDMEAASIEAPAVTAASVSRRSWRPALGETLVQQ